MKQKIDTDQSLTDCGIAEWLIPFSCADEWAELPSSESSGIGLGVVVGT